MDEQPHNELSDGTMVWVGVTAPEQPGTLRRPYSTRATKCHDCLTRHLGMCDAVPEESFGRLAATAFTMVLDPRQLFIEEDAPAEDFYVVTAGTVKLLKLMPDGHQQITGFAGAGDLLGLAISSHYAYSARAVDQVTVCRFARARLVHLMEEFPAMVDRVHSCMRNEMVLAQEQLLLHGRTTAVGRLAGFLVARAARLEAAAGTTMQVPMPMSASELAHYLNVPAPALTLAWTELRAQGAIGRSVDPAVTVRDVAALAAAAKEKHVLF
jgi:CRP/FNR family transcriptional regulator